MRSYRRAEAGSRKCRARYLARPPRSRAKLDGCIANRCSDPHVISQKSDVLHGRRTCWGNTVGGVCEVEEEKCGKAACVVAQ